MLYRTISVNGDGQFAMYQRVILCNRLECTRHLNKGYTVNNTFLERLKNNQLTNVDQYRKMRKATSEIATEESETPQADQEEWKTWQLAPVTTGGYSDTETKPAPAGAEHLHRALGKID